METLALKNVWRTPFINWDEVAPACAWADCRYSRPRWQNLLRRHEGIFCGSKWFCTPDCLQKFLLLEFSRRLSAPELHLQSRNHRIPLGLMLLSRGLISHAVLQEALRVQKAEGRRIGDCLRDLCGVTEEQITNALAHQWSCPVYPISRSSECRDLIPRQLQHFHRMLPVHFVASTRDLYVGFQQNIDYTVLLAVEQMLDCHTHPCILAESELQRLLAEDVLPGNEVAISSSITPHDLARSIGSYAQQTGAENVRILNCGAHLWIRLSRGKRFLDLLVRRNEM